MAQKDRFFTCTAQAAQNGTFFERFPYVCPEPVLAK
jgi:hypothetical protein